MKFQRQVLFATLSVTIAAVKPAAAFLTGIGVKEGGPKEVCFLANFTNKQEYHSGCTATLVARNEIVTAVHCIDDQDVATSTVLCGYKRDPRLNIKPSDMGSPESRRLFESQFAEVFEISGTTRTEKIAEDVVRILLPQPSVFSGIPLAQGSPAELEIDVCFASGFGKHSSNSFAVLRSATVKNFSLYEGGFLGFRHSLAVKGSPDIITFIAEKLAPESGKDERIQLEVARAVGLVDAQAYAKADPFMLATGDSGGPFICKMKSGGLQVIGIAHRATYLPPAKMSQTDLQVEIDVLWTLIKTSGKEK